MSSGGTWGPCCRSAVPLGCRSPKAALAGAATPTRAIQKEALLLVDTPKRRGSCDLLPDNSARPAGGIAVYMTEFVPIGLRCR